MVIVQFYHPFYIGHSLKIGSPATDMPSLFDFFSGGGLNPSLVAACGLSVP